MGLPPPVHGNNRSMQPLLNQGHRQGAKGRSWKRQQSLNVDDLPTLCVHSAPRQLFFFFSQTNDHSHARARYART